MISPRRPSTSALPGDAELGGEGGVDVCDDLQGHGFVAHIINLCRSHGSALDLDLVQLWPGIDHGRADGGVVGQKHNGVALPVKML